MPSDVLPVAAAIADSALRRAFHRWSAGPLYVGDWLITFITMALEVTTCVVLTQVLNSDQAGILAWASLSAGGFLLVAGARLRAIEAARFQRAPGARDTLMVVASAAILVLCAPAMLLPEYV